ncbi:hypothetical protein F5876DRAFT_53492, partial [Lentinula aff. lateritia]
KINIFLQSWNTVKTKLPKDLQDMIQIANKYRLRLDGLAFSRNIIREIPIWLHKEATGIRKVHNSKESRCLRQNHCVFTVGEVQKLALVTQHHNHRRRTKCLCAQCKKVRTEDGCQNPYKCFAKAMELMHILPPKWNPLKELPEDYEPEVIPETGTAHSTYFDWRITTKGTLADAFRIFTEGEPTRSIPKNKRNTGALEEINIYTDGSCAKDSKEGPTAGAGIFSPDDETMTRAIKIPPTLKQTNQMGELIAIKESLEKVEDNVDITIHSDSRTYVQGLTKRLPAWED